MKEVTAAIIVDSEKILVARRSMGQTLEGLWEFPGGKIEPGETPEECLAREIAEELGVVIDVRSFYMESIYAYDFGKIKLLAYICRLKSNKFSLSVHSETRWVTGQEILNLDLAPADIPIAKQLANFI